MNGQAGEELGNWRAKEVRPDHEEETRLLLKAGKEEILFGNDDPAGLIGPSETEDRHIRLVHQARSGPVDTDQHLEERPPPALLESVQAGVVESLALGMRAWFGYYFSTGERTGQERLSTAITGLREAAKRLQELADQLSDTNQGAHAGTEWVAIYRDAVEGWASSLTLLAEGVESDNQTAAQKGLSLLVEASTTAKLVVRSPIYPNLIAIAKGARRVFTVGDALTYLLTVSPPRRVSKTAMRHAKQPWEQAIIAAGSPFRRP